MTKPSRPFVLAALAAAAVFSWWGLRSPAAPVGEERTHPVRWEYRLIAYHPVLENMQKELDKAGQDGWEVTGTMSGAVQHIILKRPRR